MQALIGGRAGNYCMLMCLLLYMYTCTEAGSRDESVEQRSSGRGTPEPKGEEKSELQPEVSVPPP